MSEFIAEAQVRIVPNTATFRAELEAQLRALTAKPVVIPVTAVTGAAAGRNVLAEQLGVQKAGADAAAVSNRTLAAAQNSATVAATQLAFAQEAVAGASSPLAAAQITLKRSTDAVTAAQISLQRALIAEDAILAETAAATLLLAQAQEREAVSALNAARAQATHGRSLSGVAGGSASAALSLVGLRGATLAASAPFLAGAAAAIVFTKSVGAFAQLEQELNVFRVTAEATEEQMERVGETVRRLGVDVTLPAVGAADAAEAMTTLAKAGLTVEDAMAGTKGALQLATAAEIDNAEAAQIAASALNAFGLAGTEATHVADLLVGAANASQASITDMGLALKQAAAVTNLVGISIEDTVALLSLLAKNGVSASDSGTSLRTAIIRLVNPTEKARAEINKLGLELRNANQELRPDIFAQFERATRALTAAERDRIRAVIFGQDAIRAAGILGREGAAGLNEQREATNRAGEAQRVTAARAEGLSGKLGELRNNAEAAALRIGRFFAPSVEFAADVLNNTFGPATDDFSVRLRILGDEFLRVRDIISQPIALNFGDLVSDLGLLTEVARRFTEEGLEVPPDVQRRIDQLADTLNRDLAPAVRGSTGELSRLSLTMTQVGESADKVKVKMASLAQTLRRDIAVAAAGGDEPGELRGLRALESEQERALEFRLGLPQTEKNVQLATEAAERLERTRDQIQTILDGQAADTEAAASEAKATRDKTDDALIRLLGGEEQQARNRILKAAGTERLTDDLAANTILRELIQRQIKIIRDRVKDREKANDLIAEFVSELIRLNNDRKQLERQLQEQQQDRREARLERAETRIELDIELADINENTKRRVALRLQLIAQLKKEARALKLQGNALRENRNERARIRKEIEDILQESKQDQNLGAQLQFSILQQLQGFSANLLSNLIPAAATGGLLAGQQQAGPQVPVGIREDAQISQASQLGVSRGQGNETNSILRSILRQLETLNGRTIHPEATRQRKVQSGSMDTVAL